MLISRLCIIIGGIGMLIAVIAYLAQGQYTTAAIWSAVWLGIFTAWRLVPKPDRARHRLRFEIREPADT